MTTSIHELKAKRERGERFVMVTAYDFWSARVCAEADVPVVLVGDSLAMVILGYETTLTVTMDEMLHHARAVVRGSGDALLVGDMPFGSYHGSMDDAVANAVSFLRVGMHAVKLEGPRPELVARLVSSGIPVMGHLGLTPQFVNAFGGYRVQGRGAAGDQLVTDAKELEHAGAFSCVLECVPEEVGRAVTDSLSVPTIGIGAGRFTSAQVLVFHDLLGITPPPLPRFVKRYAGVGSYSVKALKLFAAEVADGIYPETKHTYPD